MRHSLLLFLLSTYLLAVDPPPEFEIEQGLVEKLYRESLEEASVDSISISSGIEITPSFAYHSPASFSLANDYFEVPYTQSGYPFMSLSLGFPLTSWGNAQVVGLGRVAYSYREGVLTARSKTSSSPDDENRTVAMKLHWVPLSLGARVDYPVMKFLKPSIGFQAGAQWLYQLGSMDGIEQGFWIPFYSIGGNLTFFDRAALESWFGGVTVGAHFQNAVSRSQTLRGWLFEVGARVWL